jgi:hypothetical protein
MSLLGPCLRGVHHRPFSIFLQRPLVGVALRSSLLPPEFNGAQAVMLCHTPSEV